MVCDPAVSDELEYEAVVPLIVPVPIDVPPSRNVTVPVGPLEIVAVKVTDAPYVEGVPDVATLSVGCVLQSAAWGAKTNNAGRRAQRQWRNRSTAFIGIL